VFHEIDARQLLVSTPHCQGILRRGIQRNVQAKGGTRSRRLLHGNVAAVILENLLHHGQSHPGAIFLAMAHKGLEQPVANSLRDSGTVIRDANFQTFTLPSQPISILPDVPAPPHTRSKEIQQSAFQFLEIEPAFGRSFAR
jgi:hypothetical protein